MNSVSIFVETVYLMIYLPIYQEVLTVVQLLICSFSKGQTVYILCNQLSFEAVIEQLSWRSVLEIFIEVFVVKY